MKEIRYCPTCGKSFQVDTHTNPRKKFCSKPCANKNRADASKKSIFTCQWCGKSFEEWTYRKPSYCSNQCRSEYGARQPKPHKKPRALVECKCLTCGKLFSVDKTQIELRGGGKYCSRVCKYKSRSITFSGENNPNYKGGVSHDNIYFRGSNWGAQKRKAVKRDNHMCQVCGAGGNLFNALGVHHIKPYRLFNGDFEAANQLSNLITLCRKHHALVECGKIPCPKPKS